MASADFFFWAVEFNENQRAVFCVFSGAGVKQLRHYLNQQKPPEPVAAVGDQNGNAGGIRPDLWDVDDGGMLPPITGMEEDGSDDDLH